MGGDGGEERVAGWRKAESRVKPLAGLEKAFWFRHSHLFLTLSRSRASSMQPSSCWFMFLDFLNVVFLFLLLCRCVGSCCHGPCCGQPTGPDHRCTDIACFGQRDACCLGGARQQSVLSLVFHHFPYTRPDDTLILADATSSHAVLWLRLSAKSVIEIRGMREQRILDCFEFRVTHCGAGAGTATPSPS